MVRGFINLSNWVSGKTSAKTNRRKKEQPFDYYVVVDFEATCDERLPGQPKYPHEVDIPHMIIIVIVNEC